MEKPNHKGKRWTQGEIDLMYDLRYNGCSYEEIGRQLGRTPNSVQWAYREYKTRRGKGKAQAPWDYLQVQEVRVSRETLAIFRNMMYAAVYEGVKRALNDKEGNDA